MRISVKAPVTVPIDFELDTAAIGREMALRMIVEPAHAWEPATFVKELERAIRTLGARALCPTIAEPKHEHESSGGPAA